MDLGFQVKPLLYLYAWKVRKLAAFCTIILRSRCVLQVYNLTTYPNLVGLFEQLGVDSEPSDMSFALSMDGGALEWGSHGLHSIFAQRRNMLSPSFLRMIWDVIRFGQLAPLVGTFSPLVSDQAPCLSCTTAAAQAYSLKASDRAV